MNFINNFPFFSIMLCMFGGIISSVLNGKTARRFCYAILTLVLGLSIVLLVYLHNSGEAFVYYMGHFPAPWGNEIRAGQLEALLAVFVSTVALCSVIAGASAIISDIEESKLNMYYILTDLMVASLLALIYTNDLFTAYVFIEINTIAGCGLIMIRQTGKAIVTAVRYMVTSLLGSGVFLIGVSLLYTITGHLLMSNIKESVAELASTGEYSVSLTVIIGLMTIGLCIKSGLFPFHLWIPDAYGNSNSASSAMMSGIVSKGYIFLLIKIYYRVFGVDVVRNSGIMHILFWFGVIAIIWGSIMAIRENSVRKIIAYSSIAQIGYIYMGIGLGSDLAFLAAIFHILAHGFTKSLLFLSSQEFTEGSHTKTVRELYGVGRKYPFAAFVFSVGAFSMIGFPLLAGFMSKILFCNAAIGEGYRMYVAIIALALSTFLNTIYFIRLVTSIYSKRIIYTDNMRIDINALNEKAAHEAVEASKAHKESDLVMTVGNRRAYCFVLTVMVFINLFLGTGAELLNDIISRGLGIFG